MELPETIQFDVSRLSPGDRRRYREATGIELDDAWKDLAEHFEQTGDSETARLADLPDDLFVPLLWIMVRQSNPDFTLDDAWDIPYAAWDRIDITSGETRVNAREASLVGGSAPAPRARLLNHPGQSDVMPDGSPAPQSLPPASNPAPYRRQG